MPPSSCPQLSHVIVSFAEQGIGATGGCDLNPGRVPWITEKIKMLPHTLPPPHPVCPPSGELAREVQRWADGGVGRRRWAPDPRPAQSPSLEEVLGPLNPHPASTCGTGGGGGMIQDQGPLSQARGF